MNARVVSRSDESIMIEVSISLSGSMLENEEALQRSLNEAGVLGTGELLKRFYTDGTPIQVGGVKFTAKKAQESKEFQTPYGPIEVDRFVYQSSAGGRTYVPLDEDSRIVLTSTPKFAKMLASKYSCDGAPGVQRDLLENHGRAVALSFIKHTCDFVGEIAQQKEESWTYEVPECPRPVKSIAVGLDGTCLNMIEDGWREAMVGTISLYDRDGERMATIYTGASPEYGKEKFLTKFGRSVDQIIKAFPQVPVVGLADGASSNWSFLKSKTDILTLDFWHMSEYLAKAAEVNFPGKQNSDVKAVWLEDRLHNAKHKSGAIARIISELQTFADNKRLQNHDKKTLETTITYLTNHKPKMQYHKNLAQNMPIGSGVTEAACKTLVKQRMCKGSARWKEEGAAVLLTLRSLHISGNRWEQFWQKYSQYGCKLAA